MKLVLGKSLYHTHLFTEIVKKRTTEETFSDFLKLDDPSFGRLKKQFENKINKLFCHPRLGHLLDSGEIDFAIMDVLEELLLHRYKQIGAYHNVARNEIIYSHLF